MKYLITGANGFLGRHFLATLARRDTPVRAMLQPGTSAEGLPGQPQVVFSDLLDPAGLAKAVEGVTHVVHLAARVHQMNDTAENPEAEFFRVNVDGTRCLLDAAVNAGVRRFLLMSTVKAMGEQETGRFDETHAAAPTDPYGKSKLAAEQAMFDLASQRGLHAVALRLPMVYGPGAKGNVLELLKAAETGRKLPIGKIRNQRSMIYVGNVVQAALLAVEHDASAGQVYLVCDDRPYSTREVYAEICKAFGKPALLRNVPARLLKFAANIGDLAQRITGRTMPINGGIIRRVAGDLCFSDRKIGEQLGYVPATKLAEGIERTVAWYRRGCPPIPSTTVDDQP
ncbi:MAG: NAD-dependent epimerase/dehydratase family protein [Phycisphaeraceae bacterium]